MIIGAVTTAWDAAHQVVSTMGDRFVLVRLRTGDYRREAGLQSMVNVGAEVEMRSHLSEVTGKLLGRRLRVCCRRARAGAHRCRDDLIGRPGRPGD